MPVTTRTRKAPEPTSEQPELINPSPTRNANRTLGVTYKDDDPFEAAFDTLKNAASDSESDVSDFGKRGPSRTKKRRMKQKKAVKKRKMQNTVPRPAPEPPELSDHELGDDEEKDGMVSYHQMNTTLATGTPAPSLSIIRLEIPANAAISLTIADLIRQNGLQFSPASPLTNQITDTTSTSSTNVKGENSFMRLPPELRNRVYRMVLVTDAPIVFHNRDNFERSAQFLRTCREVAQEGTDVMYGENAFHFERTAERRGKFWEKTWKEVGFKDIRRFLETIGPINVTKLRYLSFNLEDGVPYLNPGLDMAERRFVNDPVLHRIFNMISASTVLCRIDVIFSGRSQVQLTDYHFLKSLSGIRSPTVKFPKNHRSYPTRVNDAVLDKLVPLMTIPDAEAANVDKTKIKERIKMHFDQPTKASYSTFNW